MTLPTINLLDIINIGEPPNTEPYMVLSQPDENRYAYVCKLHSKEGHVQVYLGRWAQPNTEYIPYNELEDYLKFFTDFVWRSMSYEERHAYIQTLKPYINPAIAQLEEEGRIEKRMPRSEL